MSPARRPSRPPAPPAPRAPELAHQHVPFDQLLTDIAAIPEGANDPMRRLTGGVELSFFQMFAQGKLENIVTAAELGEGTVHLIPVSLALDTVSQTSIPYSRKSLRTWHATGRAGLARMRQTVMSLPRYTLEYTAPDAATFGSTSPGMAR